MKKIVLLGNTGFVGQNIAEVFNENNISFIGASLSQGLDLRNADETRDFFKKTTPDIIVNCAAHVGSLNYVTEQAATVITDNSRMILSMYEAATQECPNAIIINPLANCAYPAKADSYTEDHWMDGPLHPSVLSFGSTRRLMWAVGESYAMQHKIKSIYLMVPNMYGPFESTDPNKAHALNALISKFVKAEHTCSDVEIWGTGVVIREWLYARDFGRIVFQIIQNPTMLGLHEPINIAQNFGLSVKELASIIQESFPDFKGNISWNTSMPDGALKKVMNDKKFRQVFPDFKFIDMREGIKNTIRYYQSVYPF